jgi:hypothetical protein
LLDLYVQNSFWNTFSGMNKNAIKPLLHEHFVKNGCFLENPPVTSSNCYVTLKDASI